MKLILQEKRPKPIYPARHTKMNSWSTLYPPSTDTHPHTQTHIHTHQSIKKAVPEHAPGTVPKPHSTEPRRHQGLGMPNPIPGFSSLCSFLSAFQLEAKRRALFSWMMFFHHQQISIKPDLVLNRPPNPHGSGAQWHDEWEGLNISAIAFEVDRLIKSRLGGNIEHDPLSAFLYWGTNSVYLCVCAHVYILNF